MSIKVLVVDDAAVERDNLKAILSGKGYSVLTASNATDGIEMASNEKPDLIFLDVVMPGKSGYEACRAIKKSPETKDIPIILVTSKNQKADQVMGELQGASGHIGKPYSDDEIISAISKYH